MRMKLLVAGALTGLLATAGTTSGEAAAGRRRPATSPGAGGCARRSAGARREQLGTRAVSPEEALAAASLPGATVSVTAGLSLEQAVGLAPAAAKPATRAAAPGPSASDASGCAANVASWRWGTWPYDQWINDTTYWCAVYGDHITYRSSSVSAGGTLCGTNSTGSALISGGLGTPGS